jgi:hypothetical protein
VDSSILSMILQGNIQSSACTVTERVAGITKEDWLAKKMADTKGS